MREPGEAGPAGGRSGSMSDVVAEITSFVQGELLSVLCNPKSIPGQEGLEHLPSGDTRVLVNDVRLSVLVFEAFCLSIELEQCDPSPTIPQGYVPKTLTGMKIRSQFVRSVYSSC
ncbi:monocyte differentiation antigen CD14 [Platysternon megacephalum]|uniref:Monocyte differentiation antigen CD14 n=1 Tax=Platysternon megacephalum TaxID=55544 RepID=A0A4D9F2V7_9SAUR|nr:monocyte differentiation antigen CD14 [Platysternon megacephalum]